MSPLGSRLREGASFARVLLETEKPGVRCPLGTSAAEESRSPTRRVRNASEVATAVCLLITLTLVGPRFAILLWWPVDPLRWQGAFGSFWVPLLGFLLVPWSTLMYVTVAPTGVVTGLDWFWLSFALVADLASLSGGASRNRRRLPRYAR